MSKQIQKDCWMKLEEIFNSLDKKNIEEALEEFDVKEICVDGITSKIYGLKDVEFASFNKLLQRLGFTEEEMYKVRLCVIGDCGYSAELYTMLNHFIGYHEVPAQNIGKLVNTIKNDKRKIPSTVRRVFYNVTHPQMSTD